MLKDDLWLVAEALSSGFDPLTQKQGAWLRLGGGVRKLEIRDNDDWLEFLAEVEDETGRMLPVTVQFEVPTDPEEKIRVMGSCQCMAGGACCHMAALLHEVAAGEWADSGNGRTAAHPGQVHSKAGVPMVAKPRLDPVLKEWMSQLGRAAKQSQTKPPTEYPPEVLARLVFVLKVQQNRLRVEPTLVQVKPKGGYHSPRKLYFDPNTAGSVGRVGLDGDLALLRELKAWQSTYAPPTQLVFEPESERGMLERFLATGRCHYRGVSGSHPALRLGPARSARLGWVTDSKGRQTPRLLMEPPVGEVLPLSPPWYVDETTGACGPLETGVPPQVALAWLQGAQVSPGQARLLSEELARRSNEIALPGPAPIEVEEIRDVAPVPCLRLSSEVVYPRVARYGRTVSRDSRQELTLHLADMCFDYSGWLVRPTGKPGIEEEFREGKWCTLHRNAPIEWGVLEVLSVTGFRHVQEVFAEYAVDREKCLLTFGDSHEWLDFMELEVPQLRKNGWRIEVDSTFQFQMVTPESWYTDATPMSLGSDWFGAELGVMLDGKKINLLPILMQVFGSGRQADLNLAQLERMDDDASLPIRLPEGRTLKFPVGRLRAMMGILLELLDGNALSAQGRLKLSKVRAAELSGMAGGADWRWLGSSELQSLSERLRGFENIRPVPVPSGLKASLRPYQQEGLNWLQFLREYDLAGILADDMGLGKTVQALAHLLVEKESGRMDRPCLVVAPTSLMTNWRQEAERFAPDLRTLVLHGLDRRQHFDRLTEYDLTLTTYALLPRDQEVLLELEFHCVILDEAQYIKNPKTLYAQIAGQLKARHHLCLTGTPVENHLGELWSQFNFLLPGFLADEKRFNLIFRRPIEKANNEERRAILARRVAPFMLRRRKEEVARDLPPKTEIVQNVEMEGPQRDLYESIRLAMHEKVKAEVDKKGINRAHIIILDALLKLRQVCCHPQLLSLPSARKVKQSAKLDLLMDLLPEMIDEGRRVLLFSQFTSMLALIEAELGRRKIPYVLLTGQTQDRETPVRRFQAGEVPLFLISLKAGGTGLNLTAADTVIHYDPWWNPAVEDQATDRAHRIGQAKTVFVYKLMTVGTVEEKIGEMQSRKRELVEGLLGQDSQAGAKLTAEDIEVLFSPIG